MVEQARPGPPSLWWWSQHWGASAGTGFPPALLEVAGRVGAAGLGRAASQWGVSPALPPERGSGDTVCADMQELLVMWSVCSSACLL